MWIVRDKSSITAKQMADIYAVAFNCFEPQEIEHYSAILAESASYTIWCAVKETTGQPEAFLYGYWRSAGFYIDVVAVRPRSQSKGAFSAMLQSVETEVRQRGLDRISLFPASIRARRIYSRKGFRPLKGSPHEMQKILDCDVPRIPRTECCGMPQQLPIVPDQEFNYEEWKREQPVTELHGPPPIDGN